MPPPYLRRQWRFGFAIAVSAVLLAAAAGCGQPSGAEHAAATPVASPVASTVASSEESGSPAAASVSASAGKASASARPSATSTSSPKSNVTTQLAGRIKPKVTYHGKATFYDSGDGNGACLFGPAKDPTMIGAMNETDYEGSKACGAFVQVTVAGGASVTVQITNLCPLPCAPGQIDLAPQAFAKLADPKRGEVPITWKLLSPGMSDPISIRYKVGSSQYWCGIQAINHRNPLARLEVRSGSGWRQLTRASYNYFLSPSGEGCGAAIRLTDIYGEQLTVNGISISPDVAQRTGVQFAQH
jgi:expansin (peptidoglycan-binding protein)